jgi:hypothetical protein
MGTMAISLNDLSDTAASQLPPTDSRLRPDQRLLERGLYDQVTCRADAGPHTSPAAASSAQHARLPSHPVICTRTHGWPSARQPSQANWCCTTCRAATHPTPHQPHQPTNLQAEAEKQRLEQKQRAVRQAAASGEAAPFRPRWFKRTPGEHQHGEALVFSYGGGYWEAREQGTLAASGDKIFS